MSVVKFHLSGAFLQPLRLDEIQGMTVCVPNVALLLARELESTELISLR